jgi:hypothetical protein
MKRYLMIAALLFCMAASNPARSQAVVVNISSQPLWGPVGYDYVEYYFFPDYDVYYYVPTARFIYPDAGKWIYVSALPSRFGVINYYSSYKVVINQPKAYMYYTDHRVKYVTYKGRGSTQVVIRDSREPKYYVVKGHPQHGKKSAVKAGPAKGSPAKAQPGKGGSSKGSAGKGGGGKGGGKRK